MDMYNILLVVILGVALMLVLPMVASRRGYAKMTDMLKAPFSRVKRNQLGMEVQDKNAPPRAERHVSNGHHGDLVDMASQLIRFCQKNDYTLVYPGTLAQDGQLATLLALVVTPGGVVGVNCFGFGGSIRPGNGSGPWQQHINGADGKIPNPVQANEKQQTLLRHAMDRVGLSGAPCEVIAVFTNGNAELTAPSAMKCFTRSGALEYLARETYRTGPIQDPHEAAVKLKELVQQVKPGQLRKKKGR